MPYSRDWDESSPPGSSAAADIDLFLQHIKTDVRERIAAVIPGWADDGEDPKRAVVPVGDLADRPTVADAHTGEFFLALDEEALYIFDGAAWIEVLSSGNGTGEGGTVIQQAVVNHTVMGVPTGSGLTIGIGLGNFPGNLRVLSIGLRCGVVGALGTTMSFFVESPTQNVAGNVFARITSLRAEVSAVPTGSVDLIADINRTNNTGDTADLTFRFLITYIT